MSSAVAGTSRSTGSSIVTASISIVTMSGAFALWEHSFACPRRAFSVFGLLGDWHAHGLRVLAGGTSRSKALSSTESDGSAPAKTDEGLIES